MFFNIHDLHISEWGILKPSNNLYNNNKNKSNASFNNNNNNNYNNNIMTVFDHITL